MALNATLSKPQYHPNSYVFFYTHSPETVTIFTSQIINNRHTFIFCLY